MTAGTAPRQVSFTLNAHNEMILKSQFKSDVIRLLKRHFYTITVLNVPIYIHWSVLFALIICFPLSFVAGIEVLCVLAALLSIFVAHEVGHGIIANFLNLKIQRINLSIFHGRCIYDEPYHKYEDIYISWGGILGQLVLFIPTLILRLLLGDGNIGFFNVFVVFFLVFNLVFLFFNLFPIKGLDGYLAWQIIPHIYNRHIGKAKIKNNKLSSNNSYKSAAEITYEILKDLNKKAKS